MKFTLSEWTVIKCALGTALSEAEECAASLESEVKKDPSCLKDYLESKMQVAQFVNFISRIETATI
jgi:hypothetical protein